MNDGVAGPTRAHPTPLAPVPATGALFPSAARTPPCGVPVANTAVIRSMSMNRQSLMLPTGKAQLSRMPGI
jgi:hypothetical protein